MLQFLDTVSEKGLFIVKKICFYGIIIQGLLLFFMSFFICADVLMRKLFSYSIRGSIELSSYTLAVMSGWIFAYALLTKAHVRIDILYNKFSLKLRLILDVLSYLSLLIFFVPLTYYSYHFFYTSWEKKSVANTPLHTPLWIPQGLWIISLIFFVVVVFIMLLRILILIVKKDYLEAYNVGGASTLEEEIEKEKAA
ncbi:TRAP transporter small permease [Deferribacter autotrophicus]|uniref:TRAP transporter small permease n=1 Tax=Deferribacter autotrophicus TaxID=500465 RepID=A0A5A8EZ77_9BACT|nr:TRAP transporter small permease [Deferribacter autotrophicus]KAA0256990.1 TRAP transporter small permease [Deferribacter autotrophicus]